jgi:hypothetical protein
MSSLRRTMLDLVALSALPAIWTGYSSERIAEGLADVMLKTLSLELIYVTFTRRGATGVTEVARCSEVRDSAENREKVDQALRPRLNDPFASTSIIPHPLQEGMLRVASARFGYIGDAGVIIAGSSRSNFPTEQERLLISVGANQAAIAIQQKRVEEERLYDSRSLRNPCGVLWTRINCCNCASSAELNTNFPRRLGILISKHVPVRMSLLFKRHQTRVASRPQAKVPMRSWRLKPMRKHFRSAQRSSKSFSLVRLAISVWKQ